MSLIRTLSAGMILANLLDYASTVYALARLGPSGAQEGNPVMALPLAVGGVVALAAVILVVSGVQLGVVVYLWPRLQRGRDRAAVCTVVGFLVLWHMTLAVHNVIFTLPN